MCKKTPSTSLPFMHRTIKIEFPSKFCLWVSRTSHSMISSAGKDLPLDSPVDGKLYCHQLCTLQVLGILSHKGYSSSEALLSRRELFRVGTCI